MEGMLPAYLRQTGRQPFSRLSVINSQIKRTKSFLSHGAKQWSPMGKTRGPLSDAYLGGNPLSKVETGRTHDSTFLHGQGRGPLLSGERVPYPLYGMDK